jgi:hypothetical protein
VKVLLTLDPETKILWLEGERLRSPDGIASGRLRHKMRSGEAFGAFCYDDLIRLGDGWHELDLSTPAEAGRAAI